MNARKIILLYYSLGISLLYSHRSYAQAQLGSDLRVITAGEFGRSVAIDGERVAVGGRDSDPINRGLVQVYEFSGGDWAELAPVGGKQNDELFGHAVALQGNRIVAGAPYNDGNGTNAGHVRVYEWDGNTWSQLGADISGKNAKDEFGYSVALSGNRIAAGAPYNDGNGNNAGHVRVYEWDGSTWNQLGADIDGEASGDQFGWSTALEGNRLVVGARYNDGNGTDAGHVRVYEWDGSTWNQLGADIDGEASGDQFGRSVALEGDRLVVGASHNDGNGNNAGHVRVYEWDGSTWNQLGADIDGKSQKEYSGIRVDLSGDRIVVGAPYNNEKARLSGHARVYEWDGSTWNQIQVDIAGDTKEQAGWGVAIEGNRVLVGFPFSNGNVGVAKVYCIFSPTVMSVAASSLELCEGTTVNLRAISPDNTIYWYRQEKGGSPIGSSASGVNFPTHPSHPVIYYAEADSNKCRSVQRLATPFIRVEKKSPAPLTTTSTLTSICEGTGDAVSLTASSPSTNSGFVYYYDSSIWTTTEGGGMVEQHNLDTLKLVSSRFNGRIIREVVIPYSGTVRFDWLYEIDFSFFISNYLPQYAINDGAFQNLPGFSTSTSGSPSSPNTQTNSASFSLTAGDRLRLAVKNDDQMYGRAKLTITNFQAPQPTLQVGWYTSPSGDSPFASSANGDSIVVTPHSTTTYYADHYHTPGRLGCPTQSASRTPITVTVETNSTTPSATAPPVQCPNTTVPVTASGGTVGTGSDVYWYTGPNGSGTLLGKGNSISVPAGAGGSESYYARREGNCNTTADATVTVNARDYIYGLDGATSTTYCTSDDGWHHFYNSSHEILLSIQGDLSGAPAGYPQVRIRKASSHYQSSGGPFTVASCQNGYTPGEERFEMSRSWEVDFGGGTQTPPYKLRFYYDPAEKTAVESAAANWMSTYGACGYTYKYANPNGFYWFKDVGGARPHWDGLHHSATTGSVGSAPTNYAEWENITSFSGGTGGIILVPDPLLNTEWLSFHGKTDGKVNTLTWALDREVNANYFNVLRSKDGLVFEPIATVPAKGNSEGNTSYKYVDDQVMEGTSYYKIQLVYLDEKTSATHLVSLSVDPYNTGYLFYPNPSNGKVYYQYKANARDNLTVELSDMLGRKLKEEKIVSQLGVNNIPVELGDYPNGSYMIRVRNANTNNVHTSKIIKSK